jgi:SAM-dependent methyltransferase
MSRDTLLDTAPPKAVQRWSASDYARNGRFVQELAGPVFGMLGAKPGERILDLGCGDGALTAEIKASGADVLGVDLSDELLAVARMKGLTVRKVDGHALDFVSEFDAVFSNAALHWMRKPQLVIAGVHRALRVRGRFVGELGGHGNVAAIATAMRAVGALHCGDPDKVAPWFFPSVAEYRWRVDRGPYPAALRRRAGCVRQGATLVRHTYARFMAEALTGKGARERWARRRSEGWGHDATL